jgi:hypothetical protein
LSGDWNWINSRLDAGASLIIARESEAERGNTYKNILLISVSSLAFAGTLKLLLDARRTINDYRSWFGIRSFSSFQSRIPEKATDVQGSTLARKESPEELGTLVRREIGYMKSLDSFHRCPRSPMLISRNENSPFRVTESEASHLSNYSSPSFLHVSPIRYAIVASALLAHRTCNQSPMALGLTFHGRMNQLYLIGRIRMITNCNLFSRSTEMRDRLLPCDSKRSCSISKAIPSWMNSGPNSPSHV